VSLDGTKDPKPLHMSRLRHLNGLPAELKREIAECLLEKQRKKTSSEATLQLKSLEIPEGSEKEMSHQWIRSLAGTSSVWRAICLPLLFRSIDVGYLSNARLRLFAENNTIHLEHCKALEIAFYPHSDKTMFELADKQTINNKYVPGFVPKAIPLGYYGDVVVLVPDPLGRAPISAEFDHFWSEVQHETHGQWIQTRAALTIYILSRTHRLEDLTILFPPDVPLLGDGQSFQLLSSTTTKMNLENIDLYGILPPCGELLMDSTVPFNLSVDVLGDQRTPFPHQFWSPLFRNDRCKVLEVRGAVIFSHHLDWEDACMPWVSPSEGLRVRGSIIGTDCWEKWLGLLPSIESLAFEKVLILPENHPPTCPLSTSILPRLSNLCILSPWWSEALVVFRDHPIISLSLPWPLVQGSVEKVVSSLNAGYKQLRELYIIDGDFFTSLDADEAIRLHEGPRTPEVDPIWNGLHDHCQERLISLAFEPEPYHV
jgi:hypothetical protein